MKLTDVTESLGLNIMTENKHEMLKKKEVT